MIKEVKPGTQSRKLSSIENIIICNWCGTQTQIIWVHGHGQCANCGTNIEECCRGEICNSSNNQIDRSLKNTYEK
jgi:hypothetical protein